MRLTSNGSRTCTGDVLFLGFVIDVGGLEACARFDQVPKEFRATARVAWSPDRLASGMVELGSSSVTGRTGFSAENASPVQKKGQVTDGRKNHNHSEATWHKDGN